MAVPVNIYAVDSTPQASAVSGVAVGIYDPATLVQVAYGLTDSNGMAPFFLPGSLDGQSYEARFFKIGFLFTNPQLISIYEPEALTTPNGFQTVASQVGVFGAPLDPRVCRCAGRFLNYQNQPVVNALVRVAQDADLLKKTPKIVDSNAIAPSVLETNTDQNGFVVLDLLRMGEFFITFAGEDDALWNFKVPDRPTANLIDLIHPYPISLTWGLVGTSFTISVTQLTLIPVSVLFSDYVTRTNELQKIIQFMNSDASVIDLVFLSRESKIGITGRAPGSATVSVQVVPDLFPRRIPDYSIQASVLSVTVTV